MGKKFFKRFTIGVAVLGATMFFKKAKTKAGFLASVSSLAIGILGLCESF